MADKRIKSSESSMAQQLRNMVLSFGIGKVKFELEKVIKIVKGNPSGNGQVAARFISEEARQRIAEAQHRRWAKFRASKKASAAKPSSAKTGKPGRPRKVAV
jgi:hypothetical protein